MSRKNSLVSASDGALSWQQVQVAVVALGEPATPQQLDQLHALLERFVRENEDPKTSPHLRATAPDRLDALAALLSRADVAKLSPATQLAAATALKILSRRQDVRLRCTQRIVGVLVSLLEPASACSGELANAASNLSYEPANCSMLLRAQGVPHLLRLLSSGGEEVHLNAAAALQTVSFQADGRAALLKAGATATVLQRLHGSVGSKASGAAGAGAASQEGKLQQRLVGALHNLTSCAEGISALRQHGGVAAVASLLGSGHPGVAAAAAGAVQNMSLEAQACQEIRMQPRALEALAALLIGPDTQASSSVRCQRSCQPGRRDRRWEHTAGQ
ncbi:hypothetical protein COHA_006745 [Chlorella ohadii]|uniref:Uncharacterized protein n=1 Tax=Chlorella ohadii TaxID=2649997 RepID=A0AAD5H3H8_9CHLO|nr:hypothetical protein COHA_006745 [Chlorella ohadii]